MDDETITMLSWLNERFTAKLLDLDSRGRHRSAALLATVLAALRGRDVTSLHLLVRLALAHGGSEHARALCMEILRKAPNEPFALDVLGRVHLAAGRNDEALHCFRRHAELVFGPRASAALYREDRLDIEKSKRRIPFYRRLEDVLVDTAYWTIMTDSGTVYSADTHGRNIVNSPFVQGRVGSGGVVVAFGEPACHLQEECIFVGGDENYSHWLFRNLMKLSALEDDHLIDTLPWLLNRDLAPWQGEYLDILGVGSDRRILVDRDQVIRCRRVVVPALHNNAVMIAAGIEWLHRRFAAQVTLPRDADALLYVSREDAGFRHVVNEAELFARLEPFGFRKITPGRLGVAEQIRAFSEASILVAVHGAGLTNMVFSPVHASIVEINNSKLSRMDDFRRIATARGQRIDTIISGVYENPHEPAHVNSNYFVDVEAVLQSVQAFLRERESRRSAPSNPKSFVRETQHDAPRTHAACCLAGT